MSKPSAKPKGPSDRDLALFAVQVDLPTEAAAKPPEWLRIAPSGELRCRDGRTFSLDPKALVARFRADRVDIPVDLGHTTTTRDDAPALGWISDLEARADGLYGRVREWLDAGRAVLAARTHRYVSPAFHHDGGVVTWLHSVALVAAPALAMPAVMSARGKGAGDPADVSDFAIALGLDAGATRATCLAALAELRVDTVPLAVHESTLAKLSATANELRAVRAERQAEKVSTLVDGAVKALKITPAEASEYANMAGSSETGFAQVERLFAVMMPRFAPSGLDTKRPPSGSGKRTPETLVAAAQERIAAHERKGLGVLSLADAMSAAISETPVD